MPIQYYRNNYSNEELEATEVTMSDAQEVAAWCDGFVVEEKDPFDPHCVYTGINVPTEFGMVRASEGDYIVKDSTTGYFTTLKPGAFHNAFQIT